MNRGTKKLLVFMLVVLILLVAAIIFLMVKDKKPSVNTADNNNVAVIEPTQEEETTPEETTTEETTTAEPTVVDLPNEKEMRFYGIVDGNTMRLVTEYTSQWDYNYDIAIFEAFNSTEDEFYFDDYYSIHEQVWNSVETDTVYKIGYELTLTIDGEDRVYTILEPQDIVDSPDLFMGDADNEEVTGYMGVWVYCDIGQTGTYQHVSAEEYTSDTLLTSIKLRPTPQSDAVSSCKLKVFSYSSEEEFNSEGHYIGTHGYEIPVING